MNQMNIPEIKEARELFEKLDKDHLRFLERIHCFIDAIEMLDEYTEENDESLDIKKYASQLKRTYTKFLIKKLPSIDTSNFNVWVNILAAFLVSKDNEKENIINESPELKGYYEAFVNEWNNTDQAKRFAASLLKDEGK